MRPGMPSSMRKGTELQTRRLKVQPCTHSGEEGDPHAENTRSGSGAFFDHILATRHIDDIQLEVPIAINIIEMEGEASGIGPK